VNENFKKWACSLSGCDGGNVSAETWLCGIEWGGGSSEDGIYYKKMLPEQIKAGAVTHAHTSFDWKDSVTYRYGTSFAKLFAAINGKDVKDYRDLALNYWDGSELFKLHLYPIAFDSTDGSLWQRNNLDELTGFDEKHLFQAWCFVNRFPFFSQLRSEKKPKRIICTGVSYLRDFFVCFGGSQSKSGPFQFEDIKNDPNGTSTHIRRMYWVDLDEHTKLFVLPFFSGQYGLNSNYLRQTVGEKIKELSP